MSTLGEYLRKLRGKRSLREVQKHTGISHTYLSTLEKGFDPRTKKTRSPTPVVLRMLAMYYDVSYYKLLDLAGYLPPDHEKQRDLHYLLFMGEKPFYRGRKITEEEREKVQKAVKSILE